VAETARAAVESVTSWNRPVSCRQTRQEIGNTANLIRPLLRLRGAPIQEAARLRSSV
jgi:hypothetical protein